MHTRGKRSGLEADYSPPTNAKVNNGMELQLSRHKSRASPACLPTWKWHYNGIISLKGTPTIANVISGGNKD
jgi:hypothetical protein